VSVSAVSAVTLDHWRALGGGFRIFTTGLQMLWLAVCRVVVLLLDVVVRP